MLDFPDPPVLTSKATEYKQFFTSCHRTKEFKGHVAEVHSVGWNSNGKFLASGSFDRTLALFCFSLDSLKKLSTFTGHEDSIDQLCWHKVHPDLLSSTGSDKTVRLWDARQSRCYSVIRTKGENLYIKWSPDGKTIAVSDQNDLVTFIDVRKCKIFKETQFPYEVNEMSWDKSGTQFCVTNGKGQIAIFMYPQMNVLHVAKGHTDACVCIDFSPTGQYFAVGADDASVSLWSVKGFVCVRIIPRLYWPARGLHFSYDGTLLATASNDLFVNIFEVSSGDTVYQIPVGASTNTVAWHPKRHVLAYAGEEKESFYRNDMGIIRIFGFT